MYFCEMTRQTDRQIESLQALLLNALTRPYRPPDRPPDRPDRPTDKGSTDSSELIENV